MKERKKIKYGILSILLLLTLCLNIHFGDFCEGMAKGLLFAFLSIIFILGFIIIEIRDLFKLVDKGEKFDFIPLYLFILFVVFNSFLFVANENKFWREIKYEGIIEDEYERAWIVLYENNSFEITRSYIENRCTFIGKYHIEKNIINLDDENIESKTDKKITKRYLIISDSILQPLDKKYRKIKLNRK
ncbi:hypothetical protein [Flavobacterium sp. WC2509]|uniref:hypothetical protein n=1 Tax=Flavobacterium sp. WC2509 TaxID=3461406 RepID=UPI0040449CD8